MKFKYSCVLDYTPLMAAQSFIWTESLLFNKVDPSDIFIHIIGKIPSGLLDYFKEKNINIVYNETFDNRNKYCNKLVQLDTFKGLDFDYVFLMDCDTAIVSLDKLELTDKVYAKIVDFPNPPEILLKNIFKEASLKYKEAETSFIMNGSNTTDFNNCNGGVYIISKPFLNDLAPKWKEHTLWCIDNANLFTERYSKHADQVGFSLAMSSLNTEVSHLEIEWNCPTHINKNLLDASIDPKILHFHDCINEHMLIKKTGLEKIDTKIDVINLKINEYLSSSLNNSMFWNLRYALYPKLGSGLGSRGEILEYKRKLIKYVTYGFQNKSIVDVGCGDLELTKEFEFSNYTGLDVSQESLRICKEKKPEWKFLNKEISNSEIDDADFIMCFDVLIHQSSKIDFEEIVKSIVEKGNERIVIGAYNEPPEYSSDITYFYNGIFDEISKYSKFNEIGVITKYRDVSVVVATNYKRTHSRDIKAKDLNTAFTQVKRPDLLQYLVDVSRKELGFFTSHYPRVYEYSWLLEQLVDAKGASVLDIGAGVCPLPICLTEKGLNVTTIDFHSKVRLIKDKDNWNEWGFLDYSIINKNIESKNIDFSKYKESKLFDYVYSISVIEHMPRKIRVKVLQKASKILIKGGAILLTIDLIPNTENLWNLSEDKEVEPIEEHGDITTFKQELIDCGFEISGEHVQKNIKDSRTDVYYLKAILKRKSFFKSLFK
jgi:2-polyprenyl-3-methyl-5-hydroxy-6-metoxy-1,4-benzoquinol methylase